MGQRGKKRGSSTKASRKEGLRKHFFSNDLDGLQEALEQNDHEGHQEWTDQYRHAAHSSLECHGCGKVYTAVHHLTIHEHSCFSSKRNLSNLLQTSKVFWEARKRRKQEKVDEAIGEDPSSSDSNLRPSVPSALDLTHGGGEVSTAESSAVHLNGNPSQQPFDLDSGRVLVGGDEGAQQATVILHGPDSSELQTDLDAPVANRKAKRQIRLPARYQQDDTLPEPPRSVDVAKGRQPGVDGDAPSSSSQDSSGDPAADSGAPSATEPQKTRSLTLHKSKTNSFGVVRRYTLLAGSPITHDPEQMLALCNFTDSPSLTPSSRQTGSLIPHYGPFSSKAAFSMADWYWNSTNKSFIDFQKLIDIMKQPGFSVDDVTTVNWSKLFKSLGANPEDLDDEQGAWIDDDGWKSTPISIEVLFHNRMKSNRGTENYVLGKLRHRSIVSIIKEKISNVHDSRQFHYQPYHATWRRNESSPEVELYGEFYCSREFRRAHEELQKMPLSGPDAEMERVVVALMFWSDATHLTSFGPAALWPCYLYFGNESKYRRSKPSESLGHHVAYFEKLPDAFTDYLKERNHGKIPSGALLSHCIREAYQSQWNILLDHELRDAMKHGICIICPDGRRRLFFPRVFTYSADYPEKALVAGIRNNGIAPCHRCLIAKGNLGKLGAPTDTERTSPRSEAEGRAAIDEGRKEIFENGYAVDSGRVEGHLKGQSLVPTLNAFHSISAIQPGHMFNILDALVVDLMHEFEIGVWKRLYIHLIRLLHALSTNTVTLSAELDSRYRATPAFGRDSIRKFGVNASDMKRKAARDFEDLLQCAIPAFEGLLPEPQNTILMSLLYICAKWHSLAKLRLHNDFTLGCLEYMTIRLGAQMRCFDQAIAAIPTKELPKEADARARKEGKGKAKGESTRKPATLGIFTIKFHYLGDYVSSIRKRGTTDSYSTETGELAHRQPKSWYRRTDKRDFKGQMTQIERRQARLSKIRSEMGASHPSKSRSNSEGESDMSPHTRASPDCRYVVGKSQNDPLDLSIFGSVPGYTHRDKYLTDFMPKLQQHLLPRLVERLGFNFDAVPSSEAASVAFQDHRLFSHQILRIVYTTYDVRHEEDVIHVDTPQCNIMVLNKDYREESWSTEHPYLYGKVNSIFHANVSFVGTLPNGTRNYTWHRLDFAWVHWYKWESPSHEFELDKVTHIPLDRPHALGFVDPGDILRAVHVIPRFSRGKGEKNMPSRVVQDCTTWREYYINRFADRDSLMRYQLGMSVGHTYTHKKTYPPPTVPQIPPDFNYYLSPQTDLPCDSLVELQVLEAAGSAAVTAFPVVVSGPTEIPLQDRGGNLAAGTAAAPSNLSDTRFDASAEGEEELDAPGYQLEHESEDENRGLSYWDELGDRELLNFDDMYGHGAGVNPDDW